jgi:hypothetical protein
MRIFIIFVTITSSFIVASTLGAEGTGPGQQKGSNDPPKGTAAKGGTQSTKKIVSPPPVTLTKGGLTLHGTNAKLIKTGKNQPPSPQKAHFARDLKASLSSGNLNLTPAQQGAMDKLLNQQPLSFDDRQQLSNLLFNGSDAGLTSQDETALSYLLTDDMARNQGVETPVAPVVASSAGPMFLRAVNKTKEPVKVWIQVKSPEQIVQVSTASAGGATALPPSLRYDLDPGKAYDLQTKENKRLTANIVRIWAVSPTHQWASHRDQDLPLTPSGTSKVFIVTFAETSATK